MNEAINTDDVGMKSWVSRTSDDVEWQSEYLVHAGAGAADSVLILFSIAPGKRLGWHHNTAEEIQYFVSGKGELRFEERTVPVSAGDSIVVGEVVIHDLVNTATKNCGRSGSSHGRMSSTTGATMCGSRARAR